MKRQPARRHRNAVKPNLETAGREVPAQAVNEVRGPVERIDIITVGVGNEEGGQRRRRPPT